MSTLDDEGSIAVRLCGCRTVDGQGRADRAPAVRRVKAG